MPSVFDKGSPDDYSMDDENAVFDSGSAPSTCRLGDIPIQWNAWVENERVADHEGSG